jgi:hypothetical protein
MSNAEAFCSFANEMLGWIMSACCTLQGAIVHHVMIVGMQMHPAASFGVFCSHESRQRDRGWCSRFCTT